MLKIDQTLKIMVFTFVSLNIATGFAEDDIEEVIVTGKSIRASQMASIEAKRAADNVADVISADAIGRFPDQNLADALGRIPGMSIERDQGQARYINFRSAPKRYTTVAFDGIDIPGVQNGRVPRFDAYPAVITSQVVANKAITADMPGESVSGYIDVKTFSPSDIDGWAASIELGTGEQDLGGGDVERKNARVSFSNDDIGLLFYISDNLREQITDNREMEYGGTEGALAPDKVEFRNYFVDREDKAYGGTIELYLDNGGEIYLTNLNTKFTDHEQRNQWNFYLSSDTPQVGTAPSANVRRLLEDGIYVNTTDVNTFGFDIPIGNWDVEASYSRIDTGFMTYLPVPYLIGFGQLTDVYYDLTNAQQPIIEFDENLADVGYVVPYMVDAYETMNTETDQYKLDISTDNQWGTIKAGLKHDSRDGGGSGFIISVAGYIPIDISPFDTDRQPWHTGMNNTVGGYYTDNAGILDALNEAGSGFLPTSPSDETVSIKETIVSAYVMQSFDMDWGNIIVGVRVEDTDYETTGIKIDASGNEVPLVVGKTYTNVLPNAHVNWDFAEDKKLRFSLSTGISRPTYIEARAAATVDVIGMSVSGGNPELEEETSWGFDVAYEWYFADASILSVTLFHRSIDKVINQSNEKVLGSIYSAEAVAGDMWDLSAFGNGKDGQLQGLEVAFTGRLDNYIEGFFSGFGVEANLTSIDSEFTASSGLKYRLPGQSDLTYNFSVFYEDHGLSARLSYRYRDNWLDETENDTSEGIYWDEQSRLDFSVRYDLQELIDVNASIFLNMNNITDETDVRFTGHTWNPNQVESYGRRYLAGVRFNF